MLERFTCLDCGNTFDVPKRWQEKHGLEYPPYEEWSGCPICGGDFIETIMCDGCGRAITGDYIQVKKSGGKYCGDCFSAVRV